jgi:hypothetical protein
MSAMDGVSQDWVSTSTHDGVSHDGVSSVVDWVGINARFLVSFFSFFSKSTTLYSFLISLMDLKILKKLVTIPSNTTTDLLKFKNGSLNFKRLHSMVPRRNVCKILTYSKCSRCSFLRKRCTCLSIPLPSLSVSEELIAASRFCFSHLKLKTVINELIMWKPFLLNANIFFMCSHYNDCII